MSTDTNTIQIATLAAALVLQQDSEAEKIIAESRDAGVEREAIREAILQTYLFDGYPTALEGMVLLAKVWPGTPEPVEEGDFAEWETWQERGWELYQKIYGNVSGKLQANARAATPELARWMIVEGYGKVLSRGILDTRERELVNVAVLTVKQRPRQLHSHLRGSLRVGANMEMLNKLLDTMRDRLNAPGVDAARSLLDTI